MTEPKTGEEWVLQPYRNKEDPWTAASERPKVKILDVRDGWVRYDLFDSRRPITEFLSMYKKA